MATAGGTFMQASSLYGPGFGPPVGRPFTAVFGARLEFYRKFRGVPIHWHPPAPFGLPPLPPLSRKWFRNT